MERGREGGAQVDPGASGRLGETELGGVEEVAVGVEGRQFELVNSEVTRGAIEGVADHRVMERGEVDADLVGAAGVKLDFEERGGTDAGKGAPVGAGFAGPGKDEAAAGGHANAALGVTGDGEVDDAGVVEMAFDEGDVGFLDFAVAKGFAEFGVGEIGLGDEDDAGGFLVEAVDDTGAKDVAALREGLTATEERVDESAFVVSGAGVDDHAGGLVDGYDVGVFVEDVERDGFGFCADGRARLGGDGDAFAAA